MLINTYGELQLGRKSTPVYGDPSLYSTSTYSRVPGRAILSILRSSLGFSDGGPVIHFSPTNSTTTPRTVGYGTIIDGAGSNHQYVQAVTPGKTFSYTASVPFRAYSNDYLTATVLRPTGSYHLVSGGTFGTLPTATLFWVNNTGTDASLYAGINNKSSSGDGVSSVRVVDLPGSFSTEDGLAAATDTFTRSNSTNLGSSEKGGFEWQEKIGDAEIIDGKFTRVGTAATRSIFDSGTSDGIFETTFTTPAAPYATPVIYFRYQDESNWWRVWCDNSNWQLQKNVSGVQTVVGQGGWTCAPNTTHRLVVRAHGSNIVVWDNNQNMMWTEVGINDSALSTATGVGLGFGANNTTFGIDEIKVWPRTVTLPSDIEIFPTVPSSGDTTLISDTFTDSNGTRLNAHAPDTNTPGGSWAEHAGTWSINSNKVSPAAYASYTTIETGQTDMSISADFDLGDGPDLGSGDWFNNLIGRWIDNQNFMNARFLWQGNSPEIEFWDNVNGSTANFCAVSLIGDVTQNTTYNMKMVVVGKKVGIYLNDKLVLECFTSNLTGTRAGIGVDSLGLETNTYDNFIVKTAANDSAAPPEVTDLETASPTNTKPEFSWTQVIDDAIGTSFYRLYRSSVLGELGSQINIDGTTNSGSYADNSLTYNGTYYYTARPVDAHGNENNLSDNRQISFAYTGGISPPTSPTPTPTTAPATTSESTSSSASAPSCDATTPSKAPWLYGASAKSTSSILLQFSEAGDPVSEYVLEYGTEAGNYRFSATNIGGKGTRSYLVESLSPDTTYHFRVRASNGCATGEWSNAISAKTFSSSIYSSSANNSLTTEITETDVKEKEQLEEEEQADGKPETKSDETSDQVLGVSVKIKVVDENKKPVDGAKVTLYSTPREATTNQEGIAEFEGVEPGEHRAVIAYKDQVGEQKINVPESGEVDEIDFTIQVTPVNPFSNSWVKIVIGILSLGFVTLLIILLRIKKRS
jgi:hypothetical protein